METNKMLDKLNKFLAETPEEELRETWNSGNYLDKGGLKVTDWLKSKNINMEKIYENDLKAGDKVIYDGREGLVIGKTSRKITIKMPESKVEITEFKKGIMLKYLHIEVISDEK